MSLSYFCELLCEEENFMTFKVYHRNHQNTFRIVHFAKTTTSHCCTCRKDVWHGIICRHVIAVLRRMNISECPSTMMNRRWKRHFTSSQSQAILNVERAFQFPYQHNATVSSKEHCEEKVSGLLAIAKDVIVRCIYSEENYNVVHSSLLSLQNIVNTTSHQNQLCTEKTTGTGIFNPLKVKTKRPPISKKDP
jgi:SWIM zinc finger